MWWKYSVHMYVSGKMRHAETIPGSREGVIKENDGVEWIHCNKHCKCHNVPQYNASKNKV
jgi:hypothetical protein